MSDFSCGVFGDAGGAGEFSRVFSLKLLVTAWICGDIVDFVGELYGFIGSGGGALSGSELSHLKEDQLSAYFNVNLRGDQLTLVLIAPDHGSQLVGETT